MCLADREMGKRASEGAETAEAQAQVTSGTSQCQDSGTPYRMIRKKMRRERHTQTCPAKAGCSEPYTAHESALENLVAYADAGAVGTNRLILSH
jgi:hypothetical protein